MALIVCGGCRRHVREGQDCPFCGASSRTTLHLWKAAVLTAMVPLGLTACYGAPQTPGPTDAEGAAPAEDARDATTPPASPELDSAVPDPSGHDPAPEPEPEPETPEPVDTSPPEPEPSDDNNNAPDGTDTPIVEKPRPAKKYGAPPRPKPKYGGPPRPDPPPKPVPKPTPGE